MRPIKFRGRTVDTGAWVYGDLIRDAQGKLFIWGDKSKADDFYRIKPDSVSQLIAIDKFGREVYEGDLLNNGQKADISDIHEIELWDLWLEEKS